MQEGCILAVPDILAYLGPIRLQLYCFYGIQAGVVILINFEESKGSVTVIFVIPRIVFYCMCVMYHCFKVFTRLHGIVAKFSGFFSLERKKSNRLELRTF